jgi:valyl-tRNA synthetase
MLGDAAVAVNPRDNRYKKFIGKKVILPLQEREIPVIADKAIDLNFGTGAVKITPAHDFLDEEIGSRHQLSFYKIIGLNGKMTEAAGKAYEGLKILECRLKVVDELKKKNLLVKEEVYCHNVVRCYRCGTIIEPIPSLQWFVKMDSLARLAIQAVRSGKIKFHPKRWEKVYFSWLNNIKDWCISRQIWWGHKIPIQGVEDVLDTWFSSALWPFAVMGWPRQTKDLKKFYPTNVLSTARDIINLWVTRMIFSSLEFTGEIPFFDVIIHATVLTKDGKRMSKSLGTGVDPMELISKFGADATRFGLIWQLMGGQDMRWSEEHVLAGKKFANKIWNASRFVWMQLQGKKNIKIQKPLAKTRADRKILAKLQKVYKEVNVNIDNYYFGQALHKLYQFFWHDFCDVYLEISKKQMEDKKLERPTAQILLYVLFSSLKLLHPFMPFITEEIYQRMLIPYANIKGSKAKKFLMIENWRV